MNAPIVPGTRVLRPGEKRRPTDEIGFKHDFRGWKPIGSFGCLLDSHVIATSELVTIRRVKRAKKAK